MKCPEMERVMQQTIRKPIIDNEMIIRAEYNLFIETTDFKECYKENCAAWDKEKKICRKTGR